MSAQGATDPQPLTVIWRRVLDNASFEFCRLIPTGLGYELKGVILAVENGEPVECRYEVACNLEWKTSEVRLYQYHGLVESNLHLLVDDGTWNHHGPLPKLGGCIDVDIELTPATNALPINRLNLNIGQSAEIQAAWVRLPSLAVVPARQRYARLAENLYRYTSVDSGFTAEIEIGQYGLPNRYGKIWEVVPVAVPKPTSD
jgi:hypothetical protein